MADNNYENDDDIYIDPSLLVEDDLLDDWDAYDSVMLEPRPLPIPTPNELRSGFRKAYEGMTGEQSERYFQGTMGLDPPQDLPYGIGEALKLSGQVASGLVPMTGVNKLFQATKVAGKFPRIAAIGETTFEGGFQGAVEEAARGGDPVEGGITGATLAPVLEGPLRAGGYVQKSLKGPKDTFFSDLLSKVGLTKVGIKEERQELYELMKEHDVSIPGAVRPRDWYIDFMEEKGSRSTSGRGYLQRAGEKMQIALEDFADKTVTAVGPGDWTGMSMPNAHMGKILQDNFRETADGLRSTAQANYDKAFGGGAALGERQVQVDQLIDDLEKYLSDKGYDPQAAMQLSEGGEIQSLLADLKRGADDFEILGPDGMPASTSSVYETKPLKWIHARLKGLGLGNKKKYNTNDMMKLDAAHIIRENVHQSLDNLSPEHAKWLDIARGDWKAYREMLRDPLAKPFLENDSITVVNALFRSPDTIQQAREAFGRIEGGKELFDLARQRWVANLIYRGRTPSKIQPDADKVQWVLDSGKLTAALYRGGGMNQEILDAAFRDAPEKKQALFKLQKILAQADPKLRQYRGEKDVPGGPEIAGLGAIVRSLFTTIAFPMHLLMTGRAARELTAPPGINTFLGNRPQSMLERDVNIPMPGPFRGIPLGPAEPAVRSLASGILRP